MCNVISISREQDTLLMIVQAYGAELVNNILIAIGLVNFLECRDMYMYYSD
jgi:hypothetical protein